MSRWPLDAQQVAAAVTGVPASAQPRKSSPRSARWSTTSGEGAGEGTGAPEVEARSSQGDDLAAQAADVKGIKVLAAVLEGADVATLRETMDKLKDKLKTAAIVLAAVDGDKVSLIAGVTADTTGKVKAGELVNAVAQQVGGRAVAARHGASRRYQPGGPAGGAGFGQGLGRGRV